MNPLSHKNEARSLARGGLRCALLLSGAVAALMSVPTAAQAQDTIETVVVTGLRESLQRNMDIKRESLGLVDAITTEDIGKFPDSNLATAMMRIPGVTISRGTTSSSGISSSTGEPTQITVRGFGPDFNETLVEGRKLPTAMSSRAFDFSSLNSDLVSRIDVLKSPDASLSAGAIGATVNVRYPKPLDNPGMKFTASASGNISPTEGKWAPNGNFLFSNTFLGDKLGVLISGSYTESKTRVNQVSNWGWEGTYLTPCQFATATYDCPLTSTGAINETATATPVWFPQDTAFYVMHHRQMREQLRGIVEYAPTDAITLTLDGGFNRSDLLQVEYDYAIWNNAGEIRDAKISSNGTILSFIRKPGNKANMVPSDFNGIRNSIVMQTYDVGLNAKWNVTEKLTLTADLASAMASLSPGNQDTNIGADTGYGPSQSGGTNGASLGMVNSATHQLPYYLNYGPNGNAANFLDPNIMGSHVVTITSQRNRNAVNQAKFEGKWTEDNLTMTAGFQFVGNHIRMASYNTFANNQWQAYAGYGPGSNNYYSSGAAAGVALPSSLFSKTVKIKKSFMPGWSGESNLPSGLFAIDARDIVSYLESLGDPNTKTIDGYNYSCCGTSYKGKFIRALDANSWQQISEDTYAGYIAVTQKTTFAGMPLTVNAGIRSEYTNLDTKGLGKLPTSLAVSAADHTNFDVTYTDTQVVAQKNSYQYLLPNVDLTLQVTDDLQLRIDASRTLTRPPLNRITPVTTYSSSERVGSLTATGSNPDLKPYTSDNLDISAEWYYAPNSYVSGDVFLKNTTNFVISGTTSQAINGVVDPTTGQMAVWHVSSYINGPSANIYGMELAWQHVFGDTGFGFQMNGTIVQTNKPYDPDDLTSSNFAVTGLADSANLTAFYDKNGFEFRIAANWRDLYLNSFGQNQNASSFGTEPTFVNPSWSLDLSSRYDITDNITAYVEALNVLNATYSTRGRFSDQPLDIVAYGRRFTFGVHYKL